MGEDDDRRGDRRRDDEPACPPPHVIASERGYSLRRLFYVVTTTAACLTIPTVMVFVGASGPMAEAVAKGMLNIAEVNVWLYLGAGVLDRSGILSKIGEGFSGRKGPGG